MEFSRQEYSSGLPSPSPGILPGPGIEPGLQQCWQIWQLLYLLSHQGIPDICMLLLLLLLLLSRFSRVWLCATPQTADHQAPRSLGFSRQEHWSRLPFLSTMQESEKRSRSVVSRVWLLVTPWMAASQASLSMGVSRQGYWSGVSLPSPRYMFMYN